MTDPVEPTEPRKGFTRIECDEELTIYDMATFDGRIFAATDRGVYQVENDKLVMIQHV